MVRPKWRTCKKERLCWRIDVELLELFPYQSNEFYDRLTERIEDGRLEAEKMALSRKIPTSEDEFLKLLLDTHGMIFRNALPDMAGRFRLPGEDVHFGGEASHRLSGEEPEKIEESLRSLHHQFLPACFDGKGERERAHAAAVFLEKFFRIHPFLDGNGRVARLMVTLACRNDGTFNVLAFDDSGRSRRRYVRALEYAHRHAPGSEDPRARTVRDPWYGLARWIAAHLDQTPAEIGMEAEPPSGSPGA